LPFLGTRVLYMRFELTWKQMNTGFKTAGGVVATNAKYLSF